MRRNRFTVMTVSMVLSTMVHFGQEVHAAVTLKANDAKRYAVRVSRDSMNRIAVKGDRIEEVFGDNDAFEIETDKGTGQIFLKPTVENGNKPISLTLITENALIQDLLLKPADKESETVVIRGGGQKNHGFDAPTTAVQQIPGSHMQAPIIDAHRNLVSGFGQDVDFEGGSHEKRKRAGFCITLKKRVSIGDFDCFVFDVKNLNAKYARVRESDFFTPGDLSISFEKYVLPHKVATKMYVVRS